MLIVNIKLLGLPLWITDHFSITRTPSTITLTCHIAWLTEKVEILRVYARKMFHMQMEFLTEILTDDTTDAWIVGEFTYLGYAPRSKEHKFTGPPGTGKSTTTHVFCSHIMNSQGFVVTLGFHVGRSQHS